MTHWRWFALPLAIWLAVCAAVAADDELFLLEDDPGSIDAMRGIVQSRKRANQRATSATVDLITTALLYESDEQWRAFFEDERTRLLSEINSDRDRFSAGNF